MNETLAEKLRARTAPADDKGCMLWKGMRNAKGYGLVSHEQRKQKAHRLVWEGMHGEVPEGMFVLHRCDTPSCVNLLHLWLGTAAENSADMAAKGRSKRGPEHHNSRFTAEQIIEIREMRRRGLRWQEVSERFGIRKQYVYKIWRNEVWAWVGEPGCLVPRELLGK